MSANEELNLDGMASGNRREIRRFKVTEGSHLFRILPPFGTNHERKASRQVQLHWGFETTDGGTRPLVCSYPYEGSCPICEYVKDLEGLAEKEKNAGNEEQAKTIAQDAGRIKVRRSFLLNAANKDGEVGMLEIPKTAHDSLIELMREYVNKYSKNPTSLADGVWFVFSRTGKGFSTTYKVNFSKTVITMADGDQVEKLDKTPLSANIRENYDTLAYDVHAMYKPVKSADLRRVLDGEKIDEVFKYEPKKQEQQAVTAEAVPAAQKSVASNAAATKPIETKKTSAAKTTPKVASTPVPVVESEDDWMNVLNT